MELYNSPANEFVAAHRLTKMNFIDGARLGETAKTIGGARAPDLDTKSGAWKARCARRTSRSDTILSRLREGRLITVRIFGVYNAEPGATLYATRIRLDVPVWGGWEGAEVVSQIGRRCPLCPAGHFSPFTGEEAGRILGALLQRWWLAKQWARASSPVHGEKMAAAR